MKLITDAAHCILQYFLQHPVTDKSKGFDSPFIKKIYVRLLETDPALASQLIETLHTEKAKMRLEIRLEDFFKDGDFAQELEQWMQQAQQQPPTGKNILEYARLDIQGNVHIGDIGIQENDLYQEKNIIRGASIQTSGNFHLGDQISQPQHITNIEKQAAMPENLPSLPVIFTAFANPHNDLANLTHEQNGIQDALVPLEAAGKIKHLIRIDANLKAYFDMLKIWENQICIFHYAGHANSEALSLQNAPTFFKPLAEELMARNPKNLQLVFLNGCSTYGHVQALFELGVPAVIASSVRIDDQQAMQLATRFYGNLVQGDNIETAYKSAANYVKGNSTEARFRHLGEARNWRDICFRGSEIQTDFPWGLYIREEGTLNFGLKLQL